MADKPGQAADGTDTKAHTWRDAAARCAGQPIGKARHVAKQRRPELMDADLERRLRAKINELEIVAYRARHQSERDAAHAWDLECRLDEVERENVALLAENRQLREAVHAH